MPKIPLKYEASLDAKLDRLYTYVCRKKSHLYFARIAQKLQAQMDRFSGKLFAGLTKVARRFVAEMVFWIQARVSIRLIKVGRTLSKR